MVRKSKRGIICLKNRAQDFQEKGRMVNSGERSSPSFGVHTLDYSNTRKRRRREEGPVDMKASELRLETDGERIQKFSKNKKTRGNGPAR